MDAYSPLTDVPPSGETHVTDYSRWRLSFTEDGGHLWNYLKTDEECQQNPQTVLDKYWLGLPTVRCMVRACVLIAHAGTGVAHSASTENTTGCRAQWLRILQASPGR